MKAKARKTPRNKFRGSKKHRPEDGKKNKIIMIDPIFALSLAGVAASMIFMMVTLAALNSYTASLGLNPRHVPFGKIWQDTQNPAYPQLIGFIASTAALVICIVFVGNGSFMVVEPFLNISVIIV